MLPSYVEQRQRKALYCVESFKAYVSFNNKVVMNNFFCQGLNVNLGEALQFLREYDREGSIVCNRVMTAQWNFATNITDYNRRKMVNIYKLIGH